jgi:hypothetical protein
MLYVLFGVLFVLICYSLQFVIFLTISSNHIFLFLSSAKSIIITASSVFGLFDGRSRRCGCHPRIIVMADEERNRPQIEEEI